MAYFYTEDSDTGVTGQRVTGRGRGPRTGVSRGTHWAGALTGPAGPEARRGQGDARVVIDPSVRSGASLSPSCIRSPRTGAARSPGLATSLQGRRGDLCGQYELLTPSCLRWLRFCPPAAPSGSGKWSEWGGCWRPREGHVPGGLWPAAHAVSCPTASWGLPCPPSTSLKLPGLRCHVDKGCGLGAGCLFVLLWIEGKEAVSRARPVLQGRVKTHCQGSHGVWDTQLPRTQPWRNAILIPPGDALAVLGWLFASEGHWAAAIAAAPSPWHGATGTHPVGSADLAETPTPHTHPRVKESLEGHGTVMTQNRNQGEGQE